MPGRCDDILNALAVSAATAAPLARQRPQAPTAAAPAHSAPLQVTAHCCSGDSRYEIVQVGACGR